MIYPSPLFIVSGIAKPGQILAIMGVCILDQNQWNDFLFYKLI